MNKIQALAQRLAQQLHRLSFDDLPAEAIAKVKTALLDYLSCAYESCGLPWPSQAVELAKHATGQCTILGESGQFAASDAIFANAVLGHSLVREDMHTGSVSHLGIVVFPTMLAASETQAVSGRDFLRAAISGYEAGGAIGRALMTPANVHQYRPTGFSGPFAGAAALAAAIQLDLTQTTSALCFAANTASGLNQWPYSGGDEMFFQPGYTARNAWTSASLARSGAHASDDSLDGEAGLFRALNCQPEVTLFSNGFEIMQVFHKPAPACNYAQTGSQAAARAAQQFQIEAADIASVMVHSTAAAIAQRPVRAQRAPQHCARSAPVPDTTLARRFRRCD